MTDKHQITPREALEARIKEKQVELSAMNQQLSELPLDLYILTNTRTAGGPCEALVAADSVHQAQQLAEATLEGWPSAIQDSTCLRVGTANKGRVEGLLMYNFLQDGTIVR